MAHLPLRRTESENQMKILKKGRYEIQEEIKQLQRYIEHTGKKWVGQWVWSMSINGYNGIKLSLS